MNKLTWFTTLVALTFSIPQAFAVEEHHLDKPGGSAQTAPSKDGKASATKQGGMPMGMMQDSILKMHEQMHKIMQTSDPQEREKLKLEHMQMMQDHMKMMGGMMGPGMMMGNGMAGGKAGAAGEPMEKRLQTMQRRMDMMQKTLEQMQKH